MKTVGYEILFILSTSHSEAERSSIVDKTKEFLTKFNVTLIDYSELGLKDFAMELKKQKQGYYYQIQFMANREQLQSFQSELQVYEKIFRYMIVKMDSVYSKTELKSKLAVPE